MAKQKRRPKFFPLCNDDGSHKSRLKTQKGNILKELFNHTGY